MAMVNPSSFMVIRGDPQLVVPAEPTPRELKQLSDIDDQGGLRFQVPFIFFYPDSPIMDGKDPVKVIRAALAKALVFYYPFAGRLREGSHGKILVDCTGEGVLFIEADAHTTLHHLGDAVLPMCPCFEELLHDVPGSAEILGCPLLLFQVTRFRCGGFVLAVRLNHTISDGPGLALFLNAVCEMAKGATVPSVLPVWERELLNARNPPCITCSHFEYEEVQATKGTFGIMDDNNTVHRSFFFGPKEIIALKTRVSQTMSPCSTFEAVTAYLWRCRTLAFGVDPDEIVVVSFPVNIRGKGLLQLPSGYYGNAFAIPAAVSKAGELCKNPLGYAVELVKKAKAEMSEEYIKSVAALMVTKGRPSFTRPGHFVVSDNSRVGFQDLDLGWGKPLYGGPAKAIFPISFCMRFKNSRGEEGFVVPICLPLPVMERFEQQIKQMVCVEADEVA